MKKLIIMLAAVLSSAVHAAPENPLLSTTFAPTAGTILSTMTTQGDAIMKEAQAILKEGHEYYQTGKKGILISKRVEELQEEEDMSENEAVDTLMTKAQEILN